MCTGNLGGCWDPCRLPGGAKPSTELPDSTELNGLPDIHEHDRIVFISQLLGQLLPFTHFCLFFYSVSFDFDHKTDS